MASRRVEVVVYDLEGLTEYEQVNLLKAVVQDYVRHMRAHHPDCSLLPESRERCDKCGLFFARSDIDFHYGTCGGGA